MSFDRAVRVLVVDDDVTMRNTLVRYLREHNVRVLEASARQGVMTRFTASEPSLVVLDLGGSPGNGLDLLREIRSRSDVPVIITTADRCDEIDRVVGLELGADDYVIKPFCLRELVARIGAVLRRCTGRLTLERDPERRKCRFAGWQLDRRTRRLTDPNGNPVPLTKGEHALLCAFLRAPQRPLTRAQLLQVTRVHSDIFDRSIDVQVMRLRRKLQTGPDKPHVIQTARGVGYVFALAIEPDIESLPDHRLGRTSRDFSQD